MISFVTYADADGHVHLVQQAVAGPAEQPGLLPLVAPTIAGAAWKAQARELREWLQARRR